VKSLNDFVDILNAIDKELYYADASRSIKKIWSSKKDSRITVPKEILNNFNEIHKINKYNEVNKYVISRKDVFNSLPKKDNYLSIITFYLTVLVWGYPNGGRGDNINNIINSKDDIVRQYLYIKENNSKLNLNEIYSKLSKGNLKIKGMGPSTFTKVLYFMEFKNRDGIRALIFDKIMEELINLKAFKEINNILYKKGFKKIDNKNSDHYLHYCELMEEVADKLNVSLFAIEYFLFYILRTI